VSEAIIPDLNTFPVAVAIRKTDGMVFFGANANAQSTPKVGAVLPAAQTPSDTHVIEFYNTDLQHYFVTGFAAEATAVDNGAAGPGWTRTAPTRCGAGTIPVYRAYNNRFAQNDSNHRYATDPALLNPLLLQGWTAEGVVLCGAG